MSSLPAQPPAPEPTPKRSAYRSVLRLRSYRRLWIGMTVSSLGDWIGLFAMLSVTNTVAPRNTLALAGLMVFRMLPAFVIGPLAGVALDRWDRRRAMILSDIVRCGLIAWVPFVDTLPALYAISFALETVSLVWMPAKDSLIPMIVPARWLVAANSLALLTTYGVYPVGAAAFTGLVGAAEFLGQRWGSFNELNLNPENIALWIDAFTFLVSAAMVYRVRFPEMPKMRKPFHLRLIFTEMADGLRYLRERGEVTRVMRGIGFALAGGAVVFSLGAPYTTEVLRAGPKGFGGMVTVLGTGMAGGVLLLAVVGERVPRASVFAFGILGAGVSLVAISVVSGLATALVLAGLLGAFSGLSYATGFAVMQEKVADSVRGRTFASVQIVIRLSLFLSLVSFPALARLFALTGSVEDGIRLSMAIGGLVAVMAGTVVARDVYKGRIS